MTAGGRVALDIRIRSAILRLRGHNVMLDSELAELYEVETRSLLQAVRRNGERFPDDFMFQLTDEEFAALRSQIVISKLGRGGRRYLPYAFTEQGVAMLSSVLHSERAIHVNIQIMRAFVQLRQMLASHKELAERLEELEQRYDAQFSAVFEVIHQLMAPPVPPGRRLGFPLRERSHDSH